MAENFGQTGPKMPADSKSTRTSSTKEPRRGPSLRLRSATLSRTEI
jgi:hypothetical protein